MTKTWTLFINFLRLTSEPGLSEKVGSVNLCELNCQLGLLPNFEKKQGILSVTL